MNDFPYDLTTALGHRATLGLVVLQPDETIESDFRRLLPREGVALYVTRVPSGKEATLDSLGAMEHDLPAAVELLPRALRFDAIGYGCTSGTSIIGPGRVAELVGGAAQTTAVTEPLSALIAACRSLGLSRLAFLSPYVEEVSSTLRAALQAQGIETPVFGSFNEAEEAKVARMAAGSIREAALQLGQAAEAEAVFLSCTNLRTLDVIDDIEAQLGKPVLSSNQVLAWHICRLAGLDPDPGSFGSLLRGDRPSDAL